MADLGYLQKEYQAYYSAGEKCLKQQNYASAKEYFIRAIKACVDIVKMSSGSMEALYKANAEKLDEIIKALDAKKEKPVGVQKPEDNSNDKQDSEQNEENGGEDSEFEIVYKTDVSFKDIVGNEAIKAFVKDDWIDRYDPQYSHIYNGQYMSALQKGLLLYSTPGCGKTMMAKAIATEVGAAFYYVDAAKLKEKYVGESEKIIKRLFDSAGKQKKAIIFIDEIDSQLATPNPNEGSHIRSAFNQWITGIAGFYANDVIIIGATNFPNLLASSVLRFGRIGKHIRVDLPDKALRQKVLAASLPSDCYGPDLSAEYIANATPVYTIADIQGLCAVLKSKGQAMLKAHAKDKSYVVKFSRADIDKVLATEVHTSVTQESIQDIYNFEKKYNIVNENGTIVDAIKKLQDECQ